MRQDSLDRKVTVLTRYSLSQRLNCSWPGCKERDLQCLTLDHITGNGAAHRREIGRSSTALYRWIVNNNFPRGFRTLCGSHQLKAEIQRRIMARRNGDDDCPI